MIKNRYSLGLHVSTCGMVILGCLPAQQITRTADYPHWGIIADSEKKKKVDRLPTLVDNVHLKRSY